MNIKSNITNVTNKSIKKLITINNYKEGICEYIWNSFDAEATVVDIKFIYNELHEIESIIISDNGIGINRKSLDKTFGSLLESIKENKTKDLDSNVHGHKGKGRYSFIKFSEEAIWSTIYNSGLKNMKYEIKITRDNCIEYIPTDEEKTSEHTGTKVILNKVSSINKEDLNGKFQEYLSNRFAWFLYLKKGKSSESKIIVNGKEIDYLKNIDRNFSEQIIEVINDNIFTIDVIKWNHKQNEYFHSFFLDENLNQVYKNTTGFNNKSYAFPHNIYIKSNYFNDFVPALQNNDGQEVFNLDKNPNDKTFIELEKTIYKLLERKTKEFLKYNAKNKIVNLEEKGYMPKFKDNKYEKIRKDDFIEVLEELLVIKPDLFNSKKSDTKLILEFINLILDTDEREGILNIMDDLIKLTPEERENLYKVLKKTTLKKIIRTVSSIQDRLQVINILKMLVYEYDKFTNERDHIQVIIENNYWLFGEEYNMVSADRDFNYCRQKYLEITEGFTNEIDKNKNPSYRRRPDIFITRKRLVGYAESTMNEENIIVELKAPNVIINKTIYRQIEDYMDIISTDDKFNSQIRIWKFIIVGKTLDENIKKEHSNWSDKGKRFLVKKSGNYEIYAMTWDDLFKSFELNNRYILENLDIDTEKLSLEIGDNKIKDKEFVDSLVKDIIDMKNELV
ncbi:ATP-binding protein [Clostridium tertium]|jgi:hypothetical protein|uniref:ATP-binding protein n=1 Tax=Clostridium tertium TaxID=1559 RepID=UPI00232E7B0B|nr:ATP-binding protein [Clostridium tertium]MDB1935309.1 ATP-binding protein [Clostridium tertium]MDB1939044.1 ATP-binding protein [Clostridium tertium]